MVMLAEPLEKALDAAGGKVIYLTPQGRKLDHRKVWSCRRKAPSPCCAAV
jgi:tRNA G37 N-methylase TrmD